MGNQSTLYKQTPTIHVRAHVYFRLLDEQELLTLPGSCCSIFSFMCIFFIDRCLSFCTSSFGHYVPLRYTYSDYPFGIFKLFVHWYQSLFFLFLVSQSYLNNLLSYLIGYHVRVYKMRKCHVNCVK